MTSKTISVGGKVGSNGLRFSVLVTSYRFTDTRYPARYVQVKVGRRGSSVVFTDHWSKMGQAVASDFIYDMLSSSEPDLCKYLTRALMEVEL